MTFGVGSLLSHIPADVDAVAVRAGRRTVVAAEPDTVLVAHGADALAQLDDRPPGWWAGFVAYDLGRTVERVVPRPCDEPRLPDVVLARFRARLVVDTATGARRLVGDGPGRAVLEQAASSDAPLRADPAARHAWRSSLDRDGYEARVRAVLELIAAGDCYQVNLTRRLTSSSAADPVTLFRALERHNPAPYSALLRLTRTLDQPIAVVSASPECFLRWRHGEIETRPIKGTGVDAGALLRSEKDRAENVMIVDLARNDLGRVCEPGSIDVPVLCEVETHPGLHHLVSTVRGRLRPAVGAGELLRATFPPASVTGAPKPRVLQAIEDLEPVRRGVYCGAVGWIDTTRAAGELSVAIRTFTIIGSATHFGVGGGIVADSDPRAEWRETELKSAKLLAAAGDARQPHAMAS